MRASWREKIIRIMEKQSGSIKQVVFLLFFVVIIALFIGGYVVKDRQGGGRIITSGDEAPDFRLQAPDGRYFSLSEFRGKVVMVHFWATWCPPCVEELPLLDNLYRVFAGKNFEMLAVSVDEGGAESVMPFLREHGLTVPVLFDPGGDVAKQYGTFKFPETYILDRAGVVRYKAIGPKDWSNSENMKILWDLIGAQ